MIKNTFVAATAVAIATLLTAGECYAQASTPALTKANVGSIALLPPQAEMVKAKVGADDAMIEESRGLEVAAVESAVAQFESKGYRVLTLSADDVAADTELQDLVRRANDRYDEVRTKLKPKKVKKGEINLGEESQLLAQYLGVDAIAFERVVMHVAAPGQMAMALLVGSGTTGMSYLNLTVVGDDGTVLANVGGAMANIGEEKAAREAPALVAKMTRRALKKFPEASADAGADSSLAAEQSLYELESLLSDEAPEQ